MERGERETLRKFRFSGVVGEAEIERRAVRDGATRGHDDVLAPRRFPTFLHRIGQARRVELRKALAQKRSKHAVDQPARAAID